MIRFLEPEGFAELGVTTNFSFLRGASHPEELVAQAIALGLDGIGIADRNSLAGIVRAHLFLRHNREAAGALRVVVGTRLVFADGTPDILAYPQDRAAYGRLCRLLTTGNVRAEKGACLLMLADLLEWQEGLRLVALPASSFDPEMDGRLAGRHFADFAEEPAPSLLPLAGEGGPRVGEGRMRGDPASPPHVAQADVAQAHVVQAHVVQADVAQPKPPSPASAKRKDDALARLAVACPGRLWIGATQVYGRSPRGDLAGRRRLADKLGVPLIATNDVVMHDPARRPLADVLACIRHATTLDAAGRKLAANAERHLKPAAEMRRLFAEAPEAVTETLRFLDGLAFSLDELGNDYPEELREGFATPMDALAAFAAEGAQRRYPAGVPASVTAAIAHELDLVRQMAYAPYFLTVHDIVRFARGRGILCQGRGSAANSTLCFCLGITEVDPALNDLLFERFISADRKEPPDIDVDFEHERREEVMQYIYERYGRARAALTATVVTYRARSAIREVGKAFGLSEDAISALSGTIWGWGEGVTVDPDGTRRAGMDPEEPGLKQVLDLARQLEGFPRHLSQHTGGFVITRSRLDEVVPIANATMDERTTIEWDKDDLDALGILKIDVLALGMLSCLRGCFDLLANHYGRSETLATIPREDPAVYAMIQKADTIGVFQIESRAQMSMLPRLKPARFYDLVIEVAIVRPGPIQGDMVHPYLRRRTKKEKVSYPSPELEKVLGKTLGVPLFQEQAMQIAIVAAGFTPSEADQLRRAMATFKRVGTISTFYDKMVRGMVERGYPEDFATRCFKQIEGFGTYGFPESHAASFALLVYASCWMKCRYPDVFACALLNAQPMGFYAPSQIVRDAREHGVPVAEVDVNFSDWDCTLFRDALPSPACGSSVDDGEGSGIFTRPSVHPRHADRAGDIVGDHTIRLGFRQVKGLSEADMRRLVACRGAGYDSVRDLWLRTELPPSVLEMLAEADAFRSLGLDRREALWIVRGLNRAGDKDDLPLLRALSFAEREPETRLPPMPLGQHVVEDYRHLSLSLKAHPVAFVRNQLAGMLKAEALATHPANTRVTVAGLVLVRQRPGSAKGTIFLTLEDETGVANIIVWPKVFEALRPVVIGARFIAVTGKLQREGEVVHVVADKAEDLTRLLTLLSSLGGEVSGLARADEIRRPVVLPRGQRPGVA
ncbi:MAG: error-prone DNA polymerase, partial [Beijerinckiaceae bacterium]|nr:error-prone DNA polymerase [Beijerinckiaceae bacterium]